jgi:simple sugar transport system substrate-binding protein
VSDTTELDGDLNAEVVSDLSPRGVSRRRFVRNALAAGVGVPTIAAVLDACTSRSKSSGSSSGSGPWGSHPTYKFTLVNHVTTNSFFTPTRYGAQDACTLLGCSYDWTGSQNSITKEMVQAMGTAIDRGVNGIGVPVIDQTAFDDPTEKALSKGIPVVAYNAPPPTGSKTAVMGYIGQDIYQAGVEAGNRILKLVKKGDTVACMIATPGTGNIQPRADGAKSVLEPAGINFVQVATGATQGPEIPAVQSWYEGHQDVKFMYAVDSGSGIAVATAVAKNNLASKGVGGSGWDVGTPTLQQVQKGALAFTIDQQAYIQGFDTIMQLFLYNVSGGLIRPAPVDTGLLFVTKDNVGPYLSSQNRYEGASDKKSVLKPPASISS